MKRMKDIGKKEEKPGKKAQGTKPPTQIRATPAFTQALAKEIVRNLTALGELTTRPFRQTKSADPQVAVQVLPKYSMFLDTSILIDGRIVQIVNSGFLIGNLVIPQCVLLELQRIADSSDPLKRAKGRRGLDVANKIRSQKANPWATSAILSEDIPSVPEVDTKLVLLSKKYKAALMTVDFNLAHVARANGIRVLSVSDLAQALKMALVPGEKVTVHISHAGREREQGVGYLPDGTMIVVENAKDKEGTDVESEIVKVHQTPAGQLFFAKLTA